MPLAKLIELARALERLHFRHTRVNCWPRLHGRTAQRQRKEHVFRVEAILVVAADSFEIFAAAKNDKPMSGR